MYVAVAVVRSGGHAWKEKKIETVSAKSSEKIVFSHAQCTSRWAENAMSNYLSPGRKKRESLPVGRQHSKLGNRIWVILYHGTTAGQALDRDPDILYQIEFML